MAVQPMLASKCDDINKLVFPVIASEKIDGIRCFILNGMPLSRNLKPIKNQFINKCLSTWVKSFKKVPFIIDGEIIVKGTFGDTASGVMTISGTPDFKYKVFDIVTEDKAACVAMHFKERFEILKTLVNMYKVPFVECLEHHTFSGAQELNIYEDMLLEMGAEGVMLRAPNGPYKFGRSTAKEGYLLKLKKFEESEAEIIGFEEKLINANDPEINEKGYQVRSSRADGMIPAETLGSLLVKDCETGVTFNVGSGFDDALRLKIWSNLSYYKGKIITYKHFAQAGVKDKPRFPIFKGFREDL